MKCKLLLLALPIFALPKLICAAPAAPNAETQLTKVEHDWADAYVKRDPSFVQRLTADNFIFIGPDGNSVGKADYVKGITAPTIFTAFEIGDLKVRTVGDVAVVTGTATITAKTGDKDESGKYAFTDVFAKKAGEWKAISGQATPVKTPEAAK
ncbi:MAG: nuclear transport factor 2 family protein [Chthoniobacterales bacterium]